MTAPPLGGAVFFKLVMSYIADTPPLPILGTINNLVPILLFGFEYSLDLLGYRPAWVVLIPTGLIFILSLVLALLLAIPIVVQTLRGAYSTGNYLRYAVVYYLTLLPVFWFFFQTFF